MAMNPITLLPSLSATTAGVGTACQDLQIFAASPSGDASFFIEASRGERFLLAQRDSQVITAELIERGQGLPEDVFFEVADPKQVREIKLLVQENGTAGLLHFFLTPQETFLFEIDTRNRTEYGPAMKKGAGSILLTWLATQAALRGVQFAVTGIENFKVADILVKQGLIAAGTGRVEFYHSYKEGRYACTKKFSLDSESSLYAYQSFRLDYPKKFLVISGRAEPRLARSVRFARAVRGKA
jgi:hypothetical protein